MLLTDFVLELQISTNSSKKSVRSDQISSPLSGFGSDRIRIFSEPFGSD